MIVSIERETGHVRRQCDLARGQLETMRTRAAVVPASPEDRLFLVATPHRHHVRHKARNIEVLRARLLPGYNVEGEIFGANDAGEGGVVAAIEPTGPSIMAGLLLAHGKELEAWLAERGIGSDKQTVIVLPGNGREAVQ